MSSSIVSKRKISNGGDDRPLKRQAQVSSGSESEEYIDEIEPSFPVFDVATGNNSIWSDTITKVIKSVVSVHFSNITNFDTEVCLTSEATGFVVDAARGIILTNRHVVGPGPFCGYAVFDNHEEAVVKPIYRDPIHDFGFLQFNPADIKHMVVSELELRPDLAKVGTEIRVVGNDAGEKLSILAGFISRLDRNAPFYGSMTYNDFNTEYIQAAASASGGSSGSPVVNENGQAVALQAGGSTEASTDFFLPVYRPLRALKCIQDGTPVTRGDIQVEWMLRPFEECRRLGLTPESEARARELFPDKSGLLVCDIVLPQGPADGLIKEGDTLISINGEHISTFIMVDVILDDNVGKELEFVIQRGGLELKQKITIGDLHAITPNRYVDVAGASFNDISYQLARCYCIPVKGVYVNDASGTFDFNGQDNTGWVLDKINDKATPDLDTFIEVMKNIPDREKVTASFRHLSDLHTKNTIVLYIERHWQSEFRVATRNDNTGLWDFKSLQDKPLPAVKNTPQKAKFVNIPIPGEDRAACSKLSRSFVQVRSFCPIAIDGFPYRKNVGHGVVVDSVNGYVLVSRRFVPHDVCDIYLIFADSVDIPGKVVFLHPNLNYAIVKYDTSLVNADIRSPKFSSSPLKRGEKSFFIGYNYRYRIVTDEVSASSVASLNISSSNISPRYRATNLEGVLLDTKIAQECDTGILVDNDGTLRAFWLTFLGEQTDRMTDVLYRVALDVTDVKSVLDSLKRNELPRSLRIIDAEFATITVFSARARGVPQEWIDRFEEESTDEVKFLSALRLSAPSSEIEISPLRFSDVLLTVNDKLVTGMRALSDMYNHKELRLKIVREMEIMDIVVPTVETNSINTSRVLFWCGALLQEPHHGVRQLMEKIPSRVYVARKSAGGPMTQYGISTSVFITHVNDEETKDLEAFVNVTRSIPDNTYVKLRLVSYDHVPGAVSMKTNYHYFPTQELRVDSESGEWVEIEHK
ncbi:hypothetical protein OXX69_007283 [Metschnikowia pulcherrima]